MVVVAVVEVGTMIIVAVRTIIAVDVVTKIAAVMIDSGGEVRRKLREIITFFHRQCSVFF